MLKLKNKPIFCLDTYVIRDKDCIRFCCKKPEHLYEKVEIAATAGYDALELWHNDVFRLKKNETLAGINNLINKSNLFVASYKVIEDWFEVGESKETDLIIETASEIGAKSIVVKLLSDNKTHERKPISFFVDKYSKLIEKCKKYNIIPSIEFMSLSNIMNSIDDVYDILENVEDGKLVLDTWHLWRNDGPDFNFFKNSISRLNPKWISVIHYTDASSEIPRSKQVDGNRKLPHKGCLDLFEFVNVMSQKGFYGVYSLNVYDRSLWNRNPTEVAVEGLYLMKQAFNSHCLTDSKKWSRKQKERCRGLWANHYHTHLDPRVKRTDRDEKLEKIIGSFLKDKIVLDFKCGFSPLAKYVSYGFDAFEDCILYLKKQFPNAEWHCSSDEEFSSYFSKKIDVLLHIGLGDSDSEEKSHFITREKCKPSLVILECAANQDGSVNESKLGNTARWNRMINDLKNRETFFVNTNMPERNNRLIVVGEL